MDHQILEWLSKPSCYPGSAKLAEIRQTHISIVCLVDDQVYKLKKPVRFSFLDFSTLERRRHFCEEEVRLNRRLCPEMYKGVVPLFRTCDGSWSFRPETGGEIVDYAVLMDRQAGELQMDLLLADDAVTPGQVEEIARIMARFHRDSDREKETLAAGAPENKRRAVLGNFEESYRQGIFDPDLFEAFKSSIQANLEALIAWLEDRARRGFVADGHGDLHTRNIFLTDPPAIFDCIEFCPEFRCGDVAMDNAMLVMDLIYRGHPELARVYLEAYGLESGDEEQREAMPMLVGYEAMVRAKVAALSAEDEGIAQTERLEAEVSAGRHLQLAAASLIMNEPLIVMVCGLPGSGKTYFCERLARRAGWAHFSSDGVRKELAGVSPQTELPPDCYTPEFSRQTYAELKRKAVAEPVGSPVLVDANFPSRKIRSDFAKSEVGRTVLIWIDCDEKVVRQRLNQRAGDAESVSDADFSVYQKLKTDFEPPHSDEGLAWIQVDGSDELDTKLNQVLAWLLPYSDHRLQ